MSKYILTIKLRGYDEITRDADEFYYDREGESVTCFCGDVESHYNDVLWYHLESTEEVQKDAEPDKKKGETIPDTDPDATNTDTDEFVNFMKKIFGSNTRMYTFRYPPKDSKPNFDIV